MPESLAEPWLRGPLAGVDPLLAPALRSLELAWEDLGKHTDGLTTGQIWARPCGLAPLGLQLRHIAGSIDRLLTYLAGGQLDERQAAALKAEMEPGASREELLAGIGEQITRAARMIRAIDPRTLAEPRSVGRIQLPTTVVGLLVHIAEHTQRHIGQAIVTAKLARSVNAAGA